MLAWSILWGRLQQLANPRASELQKTVNALLKIARRDRDNIKMLKNALDCIQRIQEASFVFLNWNQDDFAISITCFQESNDIKPDSICARVKIWKAYPRNIQACPDFLECTRRKQNLYIHEVQTMGHQGMGSLLLEGAILYARQKGVCEIGVIYNPLICAITKNAYLHFTENMVLKLPIPKILCTKKYIFRSPDRYR